MSKPVGKVRMVSSEMRRPANDKAVFVNILCEDEAGSPFYFAAAAFGFDMKPGFPPPGDRPAQETRIEEAVAVCSACGVSGSGGLASGGSTVTIRCNKPCCPGGTSANRRESL